MPKQELQDSIRLRLGIGPNEMAPKCACVNKDSVIHANNCNRGDYINLRHDSVMDYIHKKASMMFNNTETEPKLRPVED